MTLKIFPKGSHINLFFIPFRYLREDSSEKRRIRSAYWIGCPTVRHLVQVGHGQCHGSNHVVSQEEKRELI